MFTLPCFSDRSQQCDEVRTVEPGGGCVVVPAGLGCGCGESAVFCEGMCTPTHTICVVTPRAAVAVAYSDLVLHEQNYS